MDQGASGAHDARLKQVVADPAAGEVVDWLERADPPPGRGRRAPILTVVGAVASRLCAGGPGRALPREWPPWRTVNGWFRRWTEVGSFDAALQAAVRLRRRGAGRRSEPRLAIFDTQTVKCIPVRGPPGHNAGEGALVRKRVALVDAEGHILALAVVPASVQDRDTPAALDAEGELAEPARGDLPRWCVRCRPQPRVAEPAQDAPSRCPARPESRRLRRPRMPLGR